MVEFASDVWDYLCAIGANWVVYMSAVPLVLDDFIKWCSPDLSKWIEEKVSKKTRRKAEIGFMLAIFLVANFLVFESEHKARVQAERDAHDLLSQLPSVVSVGKVPQLLANQRAWLVVDSVASINSKVPDQKRFNLRITVRMRNAGQSIATGAYAAISLDSPKAARSAFLKEKQRRLEVARAEGNDSRPFGYVIGPGQVIEEQFDFPSGSTPDYYKSGSFTVHGYMEYADANGDNHRTQFSFEPNLDGNHAWDMKTFIPVGLDSDAN